MKKLKTIVGLSVVLLLLSISTAPSILIIPSKACPCAPLKEVNTPKPNLFGLIWILLHPDCLNCMIGAIGETGESSLLIAACILTVLDIIRGDEVLTCALAGVEIPQVYAAWKMCEGICGSSPE